MTIQISLQLLAKPGSHLIQTPMYQMKDLNFDRSISIITRSNYNLFFSELRCFLTYIKRFRLCTFILISCIYLIFLQKMITVVQFFSVIVKFYFTHKLSQLNSVDIFFLIINWRCINQSFLKMTVHIGKDLSMIQQFIYSRYTFNSHLIYC